MYVNKASYIVFLCFVSHISYCQSSLDDLLSQKDHLIDEISKSTIQLEAFNLDISDVTTKIRVQRANINKLSKIIRNKEKIVYINNQLVKKYRQQINNLVEENNYLTDDYGAKVNRLYINALLNKNKVKEVNTIFGSQAKKTIFAKQYHRSCKEQSEHIVRTINKTKQSREELELVTQDNIKKLESLRTDEKNLSNLIDLDNKTSTALKSKRKQVKKQVDDKNKQLKALENTIKNLIKSSSRGKPSDILLSSKFESNKGIFPSPLLYGVVVSPFGEQSHPVNKSIKIFNNGVDILSNQTSYITSIFDGVTMSIQSVPGLGKVAIIKHGAYFSVYANLSSTLIQIGDHLKTGDRIGKISPDNDGRILHFELWKNQQQIDPENWINF